MPLVEVGRFLYIESLRDSLQTRAASIAFNVFLSLFPLVIFFFELTSHLPIEAINTTLYDLLNELLPRSAYLFVTDTISEVIDFKKNPTTLPFVLLLSLFFASNGVNSLMTAFRKRPTLIERQRSFLKQRALAFVLTILLSFVVIFTLISIIFGQIFINQGLDFIKLESGWSYRLILLFKWLVTFLLVLNFISIVYYFAPPPIKNKWSYFSPGSILATFLCIITSLLFSFYINNFGRYSLLYGYVGTVMVLLLWLYLNSFILIVGYELNLGIDVNKKKLNFIDPESDA